uniref:Uncharacterized protein n=1 Tax=Meloidogyne floridensis TaxID=298350 RepID=A0A915NZY4_9BILA
MYLKLILYIFLFFLIFINSSIGKRCKCPLKQTKNPLFHRRFKRAFCGCFGGKRATDDNEGFTRRPGKEHMREEMEVEQIQRKDIVSQPFVNKDMLVYTKREGLTVESKNFRIISVPINEEILKNFEGNMYKYKESDTYFSIGIYKEIITNENGILDWLQRDEYNNIKEYDIGIAEFDVMAGSFAVFAALGIKETFNVSSSIFPSQFLQFLEINVSHFEVPQYKFANPGDWENGIWQKDREENEEEHTRANREIKSIFENSKYSYNRLFHDNRRKSIEKPSTLEDLFNKIKYHFINQHPLIKFNNFPEHNKIVYIGGIVVEDHQLLIGGKQMVENEVGRIIYSDHGS